LAEHDVAILSGMVRHHLLLPHTATRRDVSDPATVHRIVETLDGDLVLLELLGALTEADSRATGPGVWTDWKAGLIAELVANCRTVLAGSPPPGPEPLTSQQQELAESAAASGKLGVLISGNAPDATVTVVAPDRSGLLARASGVLALNSLQVHSATLRSHHGTAVDVFGVSPRFGQLPDAALLREQLARALDGSLPLAERLLAKEQDYAHTVGERAQPHAIWFDDEATGAVVLELRAADRIGLLYRVATALEDCGADVRWARVATPGATAVSSFCLATEGEPKLDPKDCARIEEHVLHAAR
jgi:[protein-PII] uridylyltransferase